VPRPFFEPNTRRTAVPSEPVTEGRLVRISADLTSGSPVFGGGLIQVAHTVAAGPVFGWAETGGGVGDRVTVLRRGTVTVEAAAAVTAGQRLEATADGRVTPLATVGAVVVGVAEAGAALGAVVPVALV
jgi:hypothetical protein